MLLMVIALKGLLETEEGLNDEVLLVVDEAFIVMACRWGVSLKLSAIFKVFQCLNKFILLIVNNTSFLAANMAHICVQTLTKCFYCLLVFH